MQTGASAEQKQALLVLRISKRPKGVSGHPAISSKDVEVAVVPKKQLAPIVIGGWFFNLQDYPKKKISTCSIQSSLNDNPR